MDASQYGRQNMHLHYKHAEIDVCQDDSIRRGTKLGEGGRRGRGEWKRGREVRRRNGTSPCCLYIRRGLANLMCKTQPTAHIDDA